MAKKAKKRVWTPDQRRRYEAAISARKKAAKKGPLVAAPTVTPSAGTAFQAIGAMIVPTARGPHPKTMMVLNEGKLTPYVLKSVPAYVRK